MLQYVVSVALILAVAEAKFYSDCGSKLATVEDVGVSGCDADATECVLKRNTNVSITINMTPTVNVQNVETIVHGVIMNLPVPFPLPQPDACKDNGLTCPLKKGEKYRYQATLPILKSYPKVKVDVKWELKNEDDEDLVCVLIPAKLH